MQFPQKWHAGRVGVDTDAWPSHVNQISSQLPRPALHDQVAAFHRDRRQEDAVGQVLEVVEIPQTPTSRSTMS